MMRQDDHTILIMTAAQEVNKAIGFIPKVCVLALALIALALLRVDGSAETRTWSLVISAEPMSSLERAHQFSLYCVDQSEHLVGTWFYANQSVGNQSASRVVIQGEKTSDGVFWPDVALQIKNEATGNWEKVTKPLRHTPPTKLFVEPDTVEFHLAVNLDAYKPLLATHKFGRIVLANGEATEFELKYLSPPTQE